MHERENAMKRNGKLLAVLFIGCCLCGCAGLVKRGSEAKSGASTAYNSAREESLPLPPNTALPVRRGGNPGKSQ